MDVRDVLAVSKRAPHRLVDRPEGRAPADYGQLGAFAAEADLLIDERDPFRWGIPA